MLIQIRITNHLKDKLDRLVSSGLYPDLNTAAVVALENLVVAEEEHANAPAGAPVSGPTPPARSRPEEPVVATPSSQSAALAGCFTWSGTPAEVVKLTHDFPPDRYGKGDVVPVERWLFGQQNRILPLKANARLLLALFTELEGEALLNVVANRLSERAAPVGDILRRIDTERSHKKEDLLSTAFPAPDSDKSRQRYADQFVASENSAGELSGMLIDWKLATVERKKGKAYLYPTAACVAFADLRNPLFDSPVSAGQIVRFSEDEITWALRHVVEHVHVESFAYAALLKGIKGGAVDPSSLDRHLRETGAVEHKKTSDDFVATQRAGTLSRMADLDLIRRIRDGVRISYAITPRADAWLGNFN